MSIKLSKRSKLINAQPMFDILEKAKKIESKSKVIHMEIGDSSSFKNKSIKDLIHKYLKKHDSLQYSPSIGEKFLRDAISFHYTNLTKKKINSCSVAITPANAGISQIINALTDRGDSIMIPDPGFPSYKIASKKNEISHNYYSIHEKDFFMINPIEIKELIIKNKPKIIIINNPSNPLGIAQNVNHLDEIIEFCFKKKIYVLVDDTYRNLIYVDNYPRIKHLPNLVYLYSLSKDTASPALRIGAIIANNKLIKKISEDNSSSYSCLPKFIQNAAAEYLFDDNRPFRIHLRQEMAKRINYVDNLLNPLKNISYIKPNAGMYFFINVSRLKITGKKFCDDLLAKKNIAVCPGLTFGPSGKYYIRICISINKSLLIQGIKGMVDFIENYNE